MKAECLLRLGQTGAGSLVTEVRKRNFKTNPDKAIVTDEDLKKVVAIDMENFMMEVLL